MRITDTQSRSYRNKDYQKVLAQQEKEKKNQYLRPRLEMQKDFTPLVYSVDGIAVREAKNVEKRLAYHLLKKWLKHRWCIMFGFEWPLLWYAQTAF